MILSIKKICSEKSRRIMRKASAAFTIVELIVVIGIFGIIMSVALANQQELNSSLLISNLGYEIGLIVRETQAYGIGVRAQPEMPNAQNFQGAFGMNITLEPDGTADKIVVFKDLAGSGGEEPDSKYSGPDELFSVYQFQNQRGNKITSLCVGKADAPLPCIKSVNSGSVDSLNVVFKRPNPEAFFSATRDVTNILGAQGPAIIVVNTAARKNCRAVVIEATGQIRVESAKGSVAYCLDE